MSSDPITVLVADDEDDMRTLARVFLTRAGFEVVVEAIDGREALGAIDNLNPPPVPTVMVLDNRMPGLSGLEVAALVLERVPEQPIVLFSAFLTPEVRAEAKAIGVSACVAKTDIERLPRVVESLAASRA